MAHSMSRAAGAPRQAQLIPKATPSLCGCLGGAQNQHPPERAGVLGTEAAAQAGRSGTTRLAGRVQTLSVQGVVCAPDPHRRVALIHAALRG